MVNLSIIAFFQVAIGVAILYWYIWGLLYRHKRAKKYDVDFLDISPPDWHVNMFWPLLILLMVVNLVAFFF